jgi:UDP-N-acetyl-D-mannosaminuronic acid transferase (WecB/TagA/CpsF family)
MRLRCRLQHVALNVAKFVYMQKNQELRDDVLTADIIGIDGMGIVLAARLFGMAVPQRVAGVDLMERLLETCAAKGYHPYFLGATEKALSGALHNLRVSVSEPWNRRGPAWLLPPRVRGRCGRGDSCFGSRLPIHRDAYAA